MRSTHALALSLTLAACGLDGQVGNSGEYAFLPGSHVVDTAGRPLSRLMIVEEDRATERARVYLFDGELGAAGLGVADLRRLARDQGRFQMAFDAPTAELGDDVPAAGDPRLRIEADGESLELARVDDDGLYASGGSRWLRTLDSQDYDVGLHFGLIELEEDAPLPELEVQDGGPTLSSRLGPAPLTFSVEPDEERIALRYGELPGADYLIIELVQPIARVPADDVEADADAGVPEEEIVDALVRTYLAPGGEYLASYFLFNDVFGQGCWSSERPIIARLTQVARSYEQTPAGDRAVIHRRTDALELPPERWLEALQDPTPRDYCDRYQTPMD